MRLILLTGFLGSGKTTAMLSLARHLSRDRDPKSIVIIENEIGEANVDGELLAGSAYEVRDLTAGCICCTLSGQLIGALEEIRRELKPEWLLIEATGIAHQTIADVISQSVPGLTPFSIVLADAPRWEELMENLPMLITTQVENADVVLINKVDAVSPAELDRVEEEIREITSRPYFKTSALDTDLTDLWKKVVDYASS
ncbi:GTP-binding protein [Deltaproteobacteria bacterium OttesenSCG-928-M10]|nr:GTP-binding protein [Deltaproteobacteria bacterium OttesenSCG-928-M10]